MTAALPMSIPATRSANSGSSSTSSTMSSYDQNADNTVVAVRGSCGQAEIWSAGWKHQYTALKGAPGVQTVARGQARQAASASADGHAHPGNHTTPRAACPGPRHALLTPPQARQQTPARHGGSALRDFTPPQRPGGATDDCRIDSTRTLSIPISGLPAQNSARSCDAEALARFVQQAGLCIAALGLTIASAAAAPRGALVYPRLSREELEGRFLGLMAYLDGKPEGDNSMPGK